MKTRGNTILITGGGSGIGQAFAERWADAGNEVIVTGRDRRKLDDAVKGRDGMHAMTLDVRDPAAIAAFASELTERFPALNVVMNNAGIMPIEPVDRRNDAADAIATVETNLLGPILLNNALVEHLLAQQDAAIINVSSGLAFVPLIDAAVYSATKAAIHSYTAALREELKGRIEVVELAPPGVQTTLTPGQENRPGYMPLEEYVAEAFALFAEPTPPEILVERVKWQRTAEAEGRFDQTLRELNERARAARAASGG